MFRALDVFEKRAGARLLDVPECFADVLHA